MAVSTLAMWTVSSSFFSFFSYCCLSLLFLFVLFVSWPLAVRRPGGWGSERDSGGTGRQEAQLLFSLLQPTVVPGFIFIPKNET